VEIITEHGQWFTKKGTYLLGKNKKQTLSFPLSMAVINYTLGGVSIHPVTTKIQAPFLTQLPEEEGNRSGISP
jgi:hypothetical protein